jgi:hypothetical protein
MNKVNEFSASFDGLSVQHLSSTFKNCTNSYKFYWFLSLLDEIRTNRVERIPIDDLCLRMISHAWHPIVQFRMSLGANDRLPFIVENIQSLLDYPKRVTGLQVFEELKKNKAEKIVSDSIQELSRYVPYRFISPWFDDQLRSVKDCVKNMKIVDLSNLELPRDKVPIYTFHDIKTIVLWAPPF